LVRVETFSAEVLVKRFVALLMLMSGLFVAGGRAGAAVVLDTGAQTNSGGYNLDTNFQAGIAFTTGPTASNLESISLALTNICGSFMFPPCQPLTITLSLYADAGGGIPASNATALATYTAPSAQPTDYNGTSGTLNTITIGGPLSSYTLLANTSYVLIFSQPTGVSGLSLTNSNTAAAVGSNGWTEAFAVARTIDGGANWLTDPNYTSIFQLSAVSYVAPSAVPTLSEWSEMLLGLMVLTMIGWHWRKQKI